MPINTNSAGGGKDSDAIHDNVASEINSISEKGTPVNADIVLIEDSADSYNKKKVQVGNLPGGGGGEANTASSQGTGTSIYYTKVGVDLQFNAIKSENALLTVALDAVSHDVELTVNEGSIDHDNLTNTHNLSTDIDHNSLTNTHNLTTDIDHNTITNNHNLTTDIDHDTISNAHNLTTDIDHTTIQNIGSNSHAQIDTHISDSSIHFTEASIEITQSQISDLDHTDVNAIHDNVAGEIVVVTEKTTLVANDEFLIEDSANSNNKKSAKISAIRITETQITDLAHYSTSDFTTDFAAEDLANLGTKSHTSLSDIGSNSHAQIDTHIGLTDEHLNWKNSVGTIHTDNYIEGGPGTDTTAIHDDTANEISALTDKASPHSNDYLIIEDSEAGNVKKRVSVGNLPTGGGGEANTMTNEGTGAGTVYWQKDGVNLELRNLKSENSLLTIANDDVSHDVEFTVNEGSIDHANITNSHNLTTDIDHNSLTNTHNLTTDIDHTQISNIGTNSHADIDTHLALTNEHIDWEAASAGTINTDNYIEGGPGTDTTAIHDDTANEITAITEKTSAVANDEFIMEDSAAAFVKKSVKFSNIEGSIDHANITNSHNLTTDIDHNSLTNTHNLTTDIDHNSLTNTHNLTTDISHDSIADVSEDDHHNRSHALDSASDHSGELPLTDLAAGTQGSIIRRGATDWEEYAIGTQDYVLMAGATDVAWTQLTESHISDLDHTDSAAIHDNVANEITAITLKATPVSADELIIEDSEAAYVKKSITLGTIPVGSHNHDGDTLQLDGINSDGGAFSFTTTGQVTFNQSINVPTSGLYINSVQVTSTAAELNTLDGFTGDVDDLNKIIEAGRAQGDLLYASAADTLAWLTKGNDNDVLRMNGNVPNWEALPTFLENILEDTTPQLGGDLDLNDHGIAIDPTLTANQTYEGTILELTVSGLTFGQCVYVSGNNTGALADADAVGTMPSIGVFVATNKVLTHGIVRYDSWTWTAGQRVYVGTDGNLTSTAPSGTGDYVQIMGVAVNATAVMIMPSLTEVKHL